MAHKSYTRTEIISRIAVIIRDSREGDTTLRDFFVGLTDRSVWVLIEYSETFGEILSKGDRNFIISALGQAIIVVGEKSCNVKSPTRRNHLLKRMFWFDECQTNLVNHNIRSAA